MKKLYSLFTIFCIFLFSACGTEEPANPAEDTLVSLPSSIESLYGEDYEDVKESFDNAGFINIEVVPLKDLENEEGNNSVEEITVNGLTDFDKSIQYDADVLVQIKYHSLIEENVPFSSAEAAGKNYEEIAEELNNLGFYNVQIERVKDHDGDNTKNGEVESISVDGDEDYSSSSEYPINADIIVYYSNKAYNVTLKLDCDKNLLLNKYDIDVYFGGDYDTLGHGESEEYTYCLDKGIYELELTDAEEGDATVTKRIKVTGDSEFRFKLTCYADRIEISEYPSLDIPYTNKNLGKLKTKKVKSAFKEAGFEDIKLIPLKDLSKKELDKSKIVSRIVIDGNKSFTKKNHYYSDSQVVIYYHSAKVIEVPNDSSSLEEYKYKKVVSEFKKAGFTNVKAVAYRGKYNSSKKHGDVYDVKIAGDSYFSRDDMYPFNAKVVVRYYSLAYKSYSVSKLINDLKDNAYNANKKYLYKNVSLTGKVDSIGTYGMQFKLYPSDNEWEIRGVECKVSGNKEMKKISKLHAGNTITVKGQITWVDSYGYEMTVHKIILN